RRGDRESRIDRHRKAARRNEWAHVRIALRPDFIPAARSSINDGSFRRAYCGEGRQRRDGRLALCKREGRAARRRRSEAHAASGLTLQSYIDLFVYAFIK